MRTVNKTRPIATPSNTYSEGFRHLFNMGCDLFVILQIPTYFAVDKDRNINGVASKVP